MYVKSYYPRWFIVFLTFCGAFAILLSAVYVIWVIYKGQLAVQIFRCTIAFVIILGGLWFLSKILFYSVTATERGLETDNIVGSKQMFLWDEIVEVQKPHFGIPYDATYVVSKNKGKLLLIRSMKNHKELIQLIQKRAPNLRGRKGSPIQGEVKKEHTSPLKK